MSPARFASALFAASLTLGLVSCGGSDATGGSGTGEGTDGGDNIEVGSAQLVEAEITPMSDTVKGLSGDESLAYTIDLPDGTEISEFTTDINRKWENPEADFGAAEITASILWTPVAYDAASIIEGHSDVGGGDEVLDQGDEEGFSFVTFSNPGESGEIYSVTADTSRLLDDGTTLRCSSAINVAAGETWDGDQIATNAGAILNICKTAAAE